MYENIIKKEDNKVFKNKNDIKIINHYVNGGYIEILSSLDKKFKVDFFKEDGDLEYTSEIGSNMWCKTNKKYFEKYTCKVTDLETGELIFDEVYNSKGKKVFISLCSKSIGDTLAWFPYIEEFRKKWNCTVICSTFWNHLFVDNYPEIEFINPGSNIGELYATYNIGWFYNDDGTIALDKNPGDFKDIPLGKSAADILGLDFEYIKANLNIPEVKKEKRVGIAIHSTAQTKYWNNKTGWQEVTDFLISNGYEVLILSKENDGYMGNFHPKGATKLPEGSMENLMCVMKTCEFFIGVGSGLSWVSWTLNIPTVLISGFSRPISEFMGDDVIRVFNDSVCNGCYNRFRLDAGDWNWCPDQKGTDRQFECTKSITGQMVIDIILNKGWVDKNTSLCEIMRKNGSDKSTWHNYTKIYDELFHNLIGKNINIFEMGLGTSDIEIPSNMGSLGVPGASLRGWEEYFINANVYGADIDNRILFQTEGIKTFFCDQTDSESISKMWQQNEFINKQFDIIIDDGLHEYYANKKFFECSFHKLKPGGIFIIEDLLPVTIQMFREDIDILEKTYGCEIEILEIPYEKNYGGDNCLLIAKKPMF